MDQTVKKILQLLFIVLVGASLLRLTDFNSVLYRTPDEYYYRGQAQTLAQNGYLNGIKINMEAYHREEWRWKNPPSSRVGFIVPVALMQQVLNDDSERSGALVALLASVLSTLLITICAYFVGGLQLAVLTGLIAVFSPFSLALSRRCWTDGVLELLANLILCGALAIRKSPKFFWPGAIAFATGVFLAVMVKESGYSIAGLFVIAAFGAEVFPPFKYKIIFKKLLIPFAAVVAGVTALSLVLGGWDQIPKVFSHIQVAVPQAEYARGYQDGPWYDFILAWWELAPASLIFLLLGWALFLIFGPVKKELMNFLPLLLIVLLFMIPPCLLLYYKNIRYLSPLYGLFAILCAYPWAGLLEQKFNFLLRWQRQLMLVLLLAVLLFDFNNYRWVIVRTDCQDLNLKMLKECAGG